MYHHCSELFVLNACLQCLRFLSKACVYICGYRDYVPGCVMRTLLYDRDSWAYELNLLVLKRRPGPWQPGLCVEGCLHVTATECDCSIEGRGSSSDGRDHTVRAGASVIKSSIVTSNFSRPICVVWDLWLSQPFKFATLYLQFWKSLLVFGLGSQIPLLGKRDKNCVVLGPWCDLG